MINRRLLAITTGATFAATFTLSRQVWLQHEHKDQQEQGDKFQDWWERVKQRHVGNYENRLRFFAHPLKRFNYFASMQLNDGHWYMNSQDFIRSLIPFTEAYLHTSLSDWDSVHCPNPAFHHHVHEYPSESQPHSEIQNNVHPKLTAAYRELAHLADTNGDGLISYDEYLLIMSLLSIKHDIFKTAFKIFDKDGNGSLDYYEFSCVLDAAATPINERLGTREHQPYADRKELNGILARLFGKDGHLSVKQHEFESLMSTMKQLLLKCEFYRYRVSSSSWVKPLSDSISGFDFGAAVLCYVNEDHGRILDRLLKEHGESRYRITFREFQDFERVAQNINKLETGIHLIAHLQSQKHNVHYHHIGLSKPDFQKLVQSCTNITLSPPVVDILFCMFDDNGDGKLNYSEFSQAMETRASRGMNKIDHGIFGKLKRLWRSDH